MGAFLLGVALVAGITVSALAFESFGWRVDVSPAWSVIWIFIAGALFHLVDRPTSGKG